MNKSKKASRGVWQTGALAASGVFILSGCLATRNWVREQVDPVTGRVSQTENRLNETEGQIGKLDGRIGAAEGKIGAVENKVTGLDRRLTDVDGKAERALQTLGNLKFERRLVIDMKEGANFGFNSAVLPPQARKEIDGFLSDLKGDLAGGENAVFLVAGHTDNAGPEDYNYELGRRRADTVSRYLVTQKKMDPLRVVTVSYGENAPVAENNSRDGRAKNRRVEILVYREAISSNTAAASQQQPEQQRQNQKTSDASDTKQMSRNY
ncbi:MAG TPA: OmpA family protein [Candidatus Binatia bacterium]|nr:OmpA family protein [Candidatus Binatia bacterium]